MSGKDLDRRSFVGGLAAATAFAAIPRPLHALGQSQPPQKVRIACIG